MVLKYKHYSTQCHLNTRGVGIEFETVSHAQ